MMLADTNIIIDYIKKSDSSLDMIFEEYTIAVCGIVVAELLHGVKSIAERDVLLDALRDFESIPLDELIWQKVGNNLNALRKKGITVPFQDVVIATLCIHNNLQLLTKDRHFEQV
ncbi:MAG: PIN domain-containing protein, partial [Vallitaleaceae bacterium]|nr:PIN domain-containing protein [Vallitaleaceae bacterium]